MERAKIITLSASEKDAFFDELYQTYWNVTMRYFLCRCPTNLDAEDLTQEVFLRVYLHMEQLRSAAAAAAWIRQIAHNIYVSSLRKKRLTIASLSEVSSANMCNENYQVNEIVATELLNEIKNSLNSKEYQILIEQLTGYSTAEIAMRHKISPQAAKSRLYRIRRKVECAIM